MRYIPRVELERIHQQVISKLGLDLVHNSILTLVYVANNKPPLAYYSSKTLNGRKLMKSLLKYLLATVLIVGTSFQANAGASIERSIFLECNNCNSRVALMDHAKNFFDENYQTKYNNTYYFTVVNNISKTAVFMDIKHIFLRDPESGTDLKEMNYVIKTAEGEQSQDYLLIKYVIRQGVDYSAIMSPSYYYGGPNSSSIWDYFFGNDKLEVLTVEVNESIYNLKYTGVKGITSKINTELESRLGGQKWMKLAGRSIIKVKLTDGELLVFFEKAYSTDNHVYLDESAIGNNGNPVYIGGAAGKAPKHAGGGGSSSGTWSMISGGFVGCTGTEGVRMVCKWIKLN